MIYFSPLLATVRLKQLVWIELWMLIHTLQLVEPDGGGVIARLRLLVCSDDARVLIRKVLYPPTTDWLQHSLLVQPVVSSNQRISTNV